MKIKNISPYGDLDVPLLRRVVDAGETVTVDHEQAEALLVQPQNWEPADKAAKDFLAALTAEDAPVGQDTADTSADAAEAGQEAGE